MQIKRVTFRAARSINTAKFSMSKLIQLALSAIDGVEIPEHECDKLAIGLEEFDSHMKSCRRLKVATADALNVLLTGCYGWRQTEFIVDKLRAEGIDVTATKDRRLAQKHDLRHTYDDVFLETADADEEDGGRLSFCPSVYLNLLNGVTVRLTPKVGMELTLTSEGVTDKVLDLLAKCYGAGAEPRVYHSTKGSYTRDEVYRGLMTHLNRGDATEEEEDILCRLAGRLHQMSA